MAGELSFERPLIELRNKINELKKFTDEKEIDFSDEIERLEKKQVDWLKRFMAI